MNLIPWRRTESKALTQATHPIEGGEVRHLLPNTRFDYQSETRDREMLNSAVAAPVQWMQRVFPEAPVTVYRTNTEGEEEPEADHPAVQLLRRPNPYYSGYVMWMGIVADLMVTGNAYLLKVRSARDRVVELWYAPQHSVTPRGLAGDDSVYLDHYDYQTGMGTTELEPADVIHFRWGIDPNNIRLGRSPLMAVLREIFTDDEAANYAASLLRNLGIPGVVIVPDEQGESPTEDDRNKMERQWYNRFGRDNRGRALVAGAKVKVIPVSFSPQEMNFRDVRRIPEERISAATGVPAIVAGLGAGLDRSTFANMEEANEMAWENGVIPTQRLIGEDLTSQLLTDFEGETDTLRIGFDTSNVRVLQEDRDRLAERMVKLFSGGIVTRAAALRALGLQAETADEIYLQSTGSMQVDAEGNPRGTMPLAYVQLNAAGEVDSAEIQDEDDSGVADEVERELQAQARRGRNGD